MKKQKKRLSNPKTLHSRTAKSIGRILWELGDESVHGSFKEGFGAMTCTAKPN